MTGNMELRNDREKNRLKVLVIDDSDDVLFLVENILSINSISAITTDDARKGLSLIDNSVDAIVLDLMMPKMSGIDFLKEFRKLKNYSYIPVIVLTAKDNSEEEISYLFQLGANDYISKPFLQEEFIARIRIHSKIKILTEKLLKRNRQYKKKNNLLLKAIKREEKLNEKILERTIELKNANRKVEELNQALKYSSTHDELTTIYNRAAILTFLENDIQRTRRFNTELSIIMFDIDYFKKVNDTYGHLVGDEILKKLAALIKQSIREIDLFGRYGGEEFIIILPDTNLHDGEILGNRLLSNVRANRYDTAKGELEVTISIGLTEYDPGETIDALIERVDGALYKAKESGRNCMVIT